MESNHHHYHNRDDNPREHHLEVSREWNHSLLNENNADDNGNDTEQPLDDGEEGDPSSSTGSNSERCCLGWKKDQWTLLEISGSCGDFGTLLPLLVALARQRSIYLAPTLFSTGMVHVVTACFCWDIPMPLQPMKAISALAISGSLTRAQVTTAGVGMGVCFIILQFGGIIECLHRWIPKSVIGGLQFGVGWKLAMNGIHLVSALNWWGGVEDGGSSIDCIPVAILCSILCLYALRPRPRSTSSGTPSPPPPPVGIYLSVGGLIMGMIQLLTTTTSNIDEPATSTTSWVFEKEPLFVNALTLTTWEDWTTGLLQGTLPQVPLTTLNSCLSVCLLASTLFPDKPPLSRRSVCLSIGLMNLILCPLGCMPHCHGAGGLAGQHRLGATSGVSMAFLGIVKIIMSLVAWQGYLLVLLDALPVSILGVMLVLAGHELALTGVKHVVDDKDQLYICLITGLVILGTGHTHIGALAGWLTYMVYGDGYQELCCSSRQQQQQQQQQQGEDPERYSQVATRDEED